MRLLTPLLFLLMALVQAAPAQLPGCTVDWSPPVQISSDSVLSIQPRTASSGNAFHLVWFGLDTLGTAGSSGIQYSRSTDGGATFDRPRTLLPLANAPIPAVIACSDSMVYVAAFALLDTFSGAVLLRSTDGGLTWQDPRPMISEGRPEAIAAADSSVYVHYTNIRSRNGGFLASADRGSSWRRNSAGVPRMTSLLVTGDLLHGLGQVSSEIGLEEVAYFSSRRPGMVSWMGGELLSGEDTISSLRPRLATNRMGDLYAVWEEGGRLVLRQSKNEGYSWRPEQRLADVKNGYFPDVAASGGFVAVVWENDLGSGGSVGMQTSSNYARTFCPADSPGAGDIAAEPACLIEGNRIRLAWSESIAGNLEILYQQGMLAENPDAPSTVPETFFLLQNYPNPFNGATHIEYGLPKATHVRLEVYTVLGNKVAILVDALQPAARYTIAFEPDNFPSGVYLYRLRTEFTTEVRKLVLLR